MGDDGAHAKLNQLGSITPLASSTIQRAQIVTAEIALRQAESPGAARHDCTEVLAALGIRARVI